MTLATLYIYDDLNAYLEYPETNATRPVSYLFRCDPCNWENPTRCFAYSPGKLSGQIRKGEEVVCALLPVEDGAKVPCIESHYIYTLLEVLSMFQCNISRIHLGQGVKACPIMSDLESMRAVHLSASREDITQSMTSTRPTETHRLYVPYSRYLRENISALQRNGSRAPLYEPTIFSV